MKEVLLVDDHEMIRDAISVFFDENNSFTIKAQASNGKEALQILESNQFDLIITDINMPEMDGVEFIGQVKKSNPDQIILVLTMMNDIVKVKKLIGMGINGFLLKNSPKKELFEAVDKVLMGEDYYSKDVYELLISNISKRKSSKRLTYEIPLSDREKEILILIASDLSNKEIADKLFISTRTVETHKGNLLQKTGCKNIAGLVMYGVEKGII
ncbi:MAG: response regulator transcription factor [Cyclobacteriaceae bacterium]